MYPVSLDALAKAKGHAPEFLTQVGVQDTPEGVRIAYRDRDDSPPVLKLRPGLPASTSRWPRGTPLLPYGRWRWMLALEKEYLVLVEGESDCWALWAHGFPALGLPGAGTAFCLDHDDVRGLDRIYVHQEPDAAGQIFVEGVAKRLAQLGYLGKLFVLTLDAGGKDLADLHVHCRMLLATAPADLHEDLNFAAMLRKRLDAAQELDLAPYIGAVKERSHFGPPRQRAANASAPALLAEANPLADMIPGIWDDRLTDTPRPEREWVWHGLLAPKAVTLLTAVWKSGKTTLLSALLAQMVNGGSLAGRSIARGKALVVSEEADDVWYDRCRRFGTKGNVLLFCRPFPGKPFPEQ